MSPGVNAPQLYLVPCSCGKTVSVRARQAGEEVKCECGAVVHVPTIRGLKQLKTIVDEAEIPVQRSSLQGPLFSIGLLAIFIGVMIFLVSWLFPPAYLNADWQTAVFSADDAARAVKSVDEMGPFELYDEFTMLRDRTRSMPWDDMRKRVEAAGASQRQRYIAGGILLGMGGLLAIVGLALPTVSGKR